MLRYATFLLLITANAFAQTGQGTIVGRVTDTTSGIVPGVAVHLQHAGTGFTYDALTNEEGMYRIPYLNPGTYEITFEAQGFKKTVNSNITVRSTETTRVDVVLEIGQVVDSIEVKAETPLLETETSTVGHLVSGDIRNKLPTPQQKIQSILWYMPGVTSQQRRRPHCGAAFASVCRHHGGSFRDGTGARRDCDQSLSGDRRAEH